MIKRIIFDIDGTLLDTIKDCLDAYKEYFKSINEKDYSQKLWDIIEDYDSHENSTYNKEELTKYINDNIEIDFKRENLETLFKIYQNHSTILDKEIRKVLEQLSKKYTLVALSKWYTKDQVERLKKAGILKYFTNVYGFENAGIKPSTKSFLIASDNLKEEVLVVGDSIRSDIIVPDSLGMKTILYNPDNKETKYNNINNLKEIENQIRYITFEKELNYIKDEQIRNSAKILLTKLPDYFFKVPASSSGKYHPKSDLGEGGLVRHCQNATRLGHELLQLEMYKKEFNEEERDLIIYSLLFHDAMKKGKEEQKHTLFEHPKIIAEYIKENKETLKLTDQQANFIHDNMASHMGEWNQRENIILPKPTTPSEQLVHLCDYIVSRSYINIEDNNINILRRDK